MRALCYRVFLTLINIFFPPLSVALIAGFEWDCMLNSILFLCGVLPSHVHGFYISCVYFSRRKKVKKGRYPGGPKPLIHSQNVLNGGASNREVDFLHDKQFGLLHSYPSPASSPSSSDGTRWKEAGGHVRSSRHVGGRGGSGSRYQQYERTRHRTR